MADRLLAMIVAERPAMATNCWVGGCCDYNMKDLCCRYDRETRCHCEVYVSDCKG
ncbi:hypothetical protein [Pseudonocardia sp. TRM90224]|uniref:hypothetical protein n=1 Tax=Pseudonocardia sp. TRM90224 TaxID=2812678 RepID=UPI001E42F676|nr:hypothetical protein [Pseudonocardia sp. TRM90224]